MSTQEQLDALRLQLRALLDLLMARGVFTAADLAGFEALVAQADAEDAT